MTERLDHLLCYKARRARGEPRFEESGVQLENQFDPQPRTVDVRRVEQFCNPVSVRTENDQGQTITIPIVNPDAHLTCYMVKQPRPLIEAQVISTSDLIGGERELDIRKRRKTRLCVPTRNIGDSPPNLDHFDLYRARRSGGAPRFERLEVELNDPSTDWNQTVQLKRPMHFGVPTDKNGEGISDPFSHMTCYSVRAPRFRIQDVEVRNQFGRFSYTLRRPDTLCVPSSKQVISLEQ